MGKSFTSAPLTTTLRRSGIATNVSAVENALVRVLYEESISHFIAGCTSF